MSQVQRAKKMFDDSSSDAESRGSAVTAAAQNPTSTAAAKKTTEVESIVAGDGVEGDPNAFVPKSASTSQARAEPPVNEEEKGADAHAEGHDDHAEAGATMVTRVEVSPPPKETLVAKPTSAPAPLRDSAATRKLTVSGGATPAKSSGGRAAGGGAAGASSSLSTPATVSKRPMEREQREAAESGEARNASAVRREKHGASATKNARAAAKEPAPEDAAFSTVANRAESRTSRRQQRDEDREVQRTPYSATSGRHQTAAQLEYSREEPVHPVHNDSHHAALLDREATDEESEVEDFPFSTYVFPRLDPALADYHGSRTAVGAAKRGEECPPNACERSLAYLMVTDLRMAIYMAILLLSIVFVIVSIPTSQLDMTSKSCFTYWGYKADCDAATYTTTRELLSCGAIRSRLGAGAAFSIITLVVYVVNFTATIIAICCLKSSPHQISLTSRVVVGTMGGIIVITQLISWAVIAGIHSSSACPEKGTSAFGVGFGLNLTSWILNFLGVVLVVAIPSRLVNRRARV